MKKKIIIGLSIFSLVFLVSSVYTITTIEHATAKMDNLIKLHQVEILREHLLIQIKRAQSDLYLKDTPYARSVNTIVADVTTMSNAVNTCFNCHHAEQVANRLKNLRDKVEDYKIDLSRALTLRANAKRLRTEEDHAFQLGTELTDEVDNIITIANLKLEQKTQAAFQEITRTKIMLYFLVVVVPIAAIGLSVLFIQGFTSPVQELLTATRQLKKGDLSYRIDGLKDEFREVAESFNEMAKALRDDSLRMQWAEQLVVLGEMAGGLAHEIKNPLAGIKASMEVLSMDTTLPEENRDVLQKGVEQIKRIEVLLKGLLNFARPPKPHFMSVDVNSVLDVTVGLALRHPQFASRDSKTITVIKDYDSHLPKTMADPQQLQQVFLNLLLNAADAMPDGGMITVETSRPEPGRSLHIQIVDTGDGIDEAVVDKIFQPFFTTKPHGTGLGLAITKRLIEQHGGSISVKNNHAKGVSFIITLPVRDGEEVQTI
ncbi:MAG TPA: ATP-binding protein [Nitrospirota bacterium]|nr:ATP-binding protein [Nitrospirota bacterium]